MAINIADGFQYLGKKSLDARTSYTTLATMKAVADANINEGCLAYCAETDKYYKFNSTNTVDASTGKWREYSSGGGGSSTNYSLTEQEIGTWIDGSTLYSIIAPNVSVNMGGSTGDISSTPQTLKSYTAVTAGDYVFTSMTGYTNCGNNEGFIGFYKNGTQIATRPLRTDQTIPLSDVNVSLQVGDVVTTKFEFIGSHTCKATLVASLLPTVASGASIKFKKTTIDTLYNYFEYTKPSV